jgi:hypothetical protein
VKAEAKALFWRVFDELADNWRRYLRNGCIAYLIFAAVHALVEVLS